MKKRIILTIDYKYQILVESGKITLKWPLTYFVGNVWVICNKIRMFLLLLNNLVFNSIVLIYKLFSSIDQLKPLKLHKIVQNYPLCPLPPFAASFFNSKSKLSGKCYLVLCWWMVLLLLSHMCTHLSGSKNFSWKWIVILFSMPYHHLQWFIWSWFTWIQNL